MKISKLFFLPVLSLFIGTALAMDAEDDAATFAGALHNQVVRAERDFPSQMKYGKSKMGLTSPERRRRIVGYLHKWNDSNKFYENFNQCRFAAVDWNRYALDVEEGRESRYKATYKQEIVQCRAQLTNWFKRECSKLKNTNCAYELKMYQRVTLNPTEDA